MVWRHNFVYYLCKTLIVLLILILFTNSSITSHKKQLQQIENEIKKNKLLIQKAQKKEKVALNDIENIEEQLLISRKKIDRLIKNKNYTELKIKNMNKHLNSLDKDFIQMKSNVKTILKNWYIYNTIYNYNHLSGFDFPYSIIKYEILQHLNTKNYNYIQNVITKKKNYSKKIKDYQREYNKLKKMQAILELNLKSIKTEKELKKIYIQKLKREKKKYKSYLLSLERKKKRLKQELEKILIASRKRTHKKNFVKGRLKNYRKLLSNPANGKIISHFGKKWNSDYEIYINNDGIEYLLNNGEIYSPCKGKVLYADWLKGKGNVVIINYDSHLSLIFGNLDEIYVKKGQTIEKKQLIGKISNLNNERILYFGTWLDGKPVDPEYIIK